MPDNGVRTIDLTSLASAEDLLVHQGGTLGVLSRETLALLLAASGALADRLAELDRAASYASILRPTWTALAALAPTAIGQQAEVSPEDSGSHTDPQTSETVNNAGRYTAFGTSAGQWTWVDGGGLGSKLSISNYLGEFSGPFQSTARFNIGAASQVALDAAEAAIATKADATALAEKADADAVVALTGNQTISDVKTFEQAPVVPDGAFPLAKVDGAASATALATETATRGDLIAPRSSAADETVYTDSRGFISHRVSPQRARSRSWEVGSEYLRAGNFAMSETSEGGLIAVDGRGFFQRLAQPVQPVSATAVPGVIATDRRGFFHRLDNPAPAAPPAISGNLSLYALRALLASLLAGATVTAKIIQMGDSWTERRDIPQAMADLLYARYGQGADGYISFGQTTGEINSVAVAYSGFANTDITSSTTGTFGPCGHRLSATGTAATASVSGIRAETIHLYYLDGDGTFRYRIDGGAWVDVVGTGSGDPARATVSGLSTGATHTVEIDTTGNAGTVTLYCLYATGMAGVELSKIGNASARADHYWHYINAAVSTLVLGDIAAQAMYLSLGTNDRVANVDPDVFGGYQRLILDALQAANSDCACILAAPPENGWAGRYSMAQYAASSVDLALADPLVEHVDFTRIFPDYTTANTLGLWSDSAHLNANGARFFASTVYRNFFHLD